MIDEPLPDDKRRDSRIHRFDPSHAEAEADPEPVPAHCPHCGSRNIITSLCEPPARQYAVATCGDCAKWIKWLPKPHTLAEALDFPMPFGKYENMPMGQVPDDYLRWMVSDLRRKRGLVERARLILASREKGGAK
jgi:hypothetical protein